MYTNGIYMYDPDFMIPKWLKFDGFDNLKLIVLHCIISVDITL